MAGITWTSFKEVSLVLLQGFGQNCVLFLTTLLLALPLGLLITFGSMSKIKPLRWLVRTFVWIIRGTPLMLQLFVVMYVPGLLWGYTFPKHILWMPINQRMVAAMIAFVINYAAYFSEIYRGGIEAIPRGQYEAGQVLGMKNSEIFRKVVLMQVVKRIVPPMGNEIITLIKDTSLARVIAVSELLMKSYEYVNKGVIWPLFYTGVFFLVFCGGLTVLFGQIEKRLNYYKG